MVLLDGADRLAKTGLESIAARAVMKRGMKRIGPFFLQDTTSIVQGNLTRESGRDYPDMTIQPSESSKCPPSQRLLY